MAGAAAPGRRGAAGHDVAVIPVDDAVIALWSQLATEPVHESRARESIGDDFTDALLQTGALVPHR